MKTRTVFYKTFEGTSYEIGKQLGNWALSDKDRLSRLVLRQNTYPDEKLKEIMSLLDKYCSGINDEIRGFADSIEVGMDRILFYAMTYLERGCSIMTALPAKTENGHTIMARNYDFNDEMEDMCITKMKVEGKYSHISSTIGLFGRSDGMNEHGLAVCMSCNAPAVGNLPGMHKPSITGLQFWVVIRSILENCMDVEEAIDYAMITPVAYNLNLMLADKNNNIALLQCIDGHKLYKMLNDQNNETFLSAANHVIFPELKQYEKMLMKNSVRRNELMVNTFNEKGKISGNDLKHLLSTSYPQGLCCYYYEEFFGTVYSMIFDVTDSAIDIRFGSPLYNKWRKFRISDELNLKETVSLIYEKAPKNFW